LFQKAQLANHTAKSLRTFSVFDYQFFKWLTPFKEAQLNSPLIIHHSQMLSCLR